MAKEQRRCKKCGRFMSKMYTFVYFFNPTCVRCDHVREDYALVP